MREAESRIPVESGEVSALLTRPDDARALYVLAHGAGAGMRHAFLERMARELARRGVATLRYQFPYMEAGSRRTDRPAVAHAAVRAAIDHAAALEPELPLFAGGKSFGGRMTSQALAERDDERVRGVVFLGFPLHAPKKPSTTRAEHLARVRPPMLFLQGTRDDLADLELVREVTEPLTNATVHVVEGGDHSFKVLKRSGRAEDEVFAELAGTIREWVSAVSG